MNFAQRYLLPRILLILSFTALLLGSYSPYLSSQASAPLCPSGYAVGVSGGNTTSGVYSGVINVFLGSPTTTAQSITKVIIRANEQPIGRALPTGNGSYTWNMPWASSLTFHGSPVAVKLDAEVFVSGASTPCISQNTSINVYNATASSFTAHASLPSGPWPMSYSFPIAITVRAHDLDVSNFALYQWNTTIGNLNPNFNNAQFSTGQTVGNGNVVVRVKYGGKEVPITIPISVQEANAPLPTSHSTTTSTSSNDAVKQTTVDTTPRITAIQNNPLAQECITGTLGTDRFATINNGTTRPTVEEIRRFNVCFASNNYILPSNFAPVAPAAIKELPKNEKFTVQKPENVSHTNDSGEVKALKLSGKAAPNSLVVIYVFSDPLVLTTTADAEGNWTYTLADPIEAGDHEIYTVVDRGDGVYERSDPVSFIIGTAEAAENNPSGLSLQLADSLTPAQSNRSLYLYIAAFMSTLMVIFVVLGLILRRQKQKAAALASELSQSVDASTDSSSTSDETQHIDKS
jgi:hypothetical protein